jgi:phosphatidylethanolamine/phosphatidyl-N-methylethanolamine N-methyltransferase
MSDRAEILHGFYADDYARVAVSARDSAAGRYLHGAIEKRLGPDATFARVLELGGNRGEHVPFVRHAFEEYHLTDLRMPQPPPHIADDPRVHLRAVDAASTPYADGEFDRVISTCLLHHVDDPMGVAQEMRRVTRPRGVVSILLPTDPGLAYRTTHWLTYGRPARRAGTAQRSRLLHAIDHRNHFRSIAAQLRSVFEHDDVRVSWLPTRLRSVELNVLTVWQVTVR